MCFKSQCRDVSRRLGTSSLLHHATSSIIFSVLNFFLLRAETILGNLTETTLSIFDPFYRRASARSLILNRESARDEKSRSQNQNLKPSKSPHQLSHSRKSSKIVMVPAKKLVQFEVCKQTLAVALLLSDS